MRARATTDHGNRSVFPIPSLTRALIRPSYTILLPPRGLVADSECKTRANRSNQRVAMFAQLGSTTILARCFGVFFLPRIFFLFYPPPLFLSLTLAHVYRAYQKLCSKFRFLSEFKANLSIIVYQIYYLVIQCYVLREENV